MAEYIFQPRRRLFHDEVWVREGYQRPPSPDGVGETPPRERRARARVTSRRSPHFSPLTTFPVFSPLREEDAEEEEEGFAPNTPAPKETRSK